MKKPVKRMLMAVTALGAVLAVGLATTTVVNIVATSGEINRIESYGERVTVDGGQMNIQVTGNGGETIVLLPGFGTSSPALDFAPLVTDLARDHRVVVVEPFGYGLSDGTDRPRTTENIASEVHDALHVLDIDRYVLMGHSIAGIYALEYVARYPEEVTAFVGIDTSAPGQPNMDTQFPTAILGLAKNLGLLRVANDVSTESGPPYTNHAREQMKMLSNRNSLTPTYLDEMARIGANFENARDATFPAQLPLLLFVEADNAKNPDWIGLHERQAASVDDGTVIPIPGTHYLHHTHAADMAEMFRQWQAN